MALARSRASEFSFPGAVARHRRMARTSRLMLPYNSSSYLTALLRHGRRTYAVAPSFQSRRAVSPFFPDAYTFPLLLKEAVASARGSPLEGQKLHALVIKFGFSYCVYASTALVDFYAKAGDLVSARDVFDAMPRRTLPSWTAIMVGHARCGDMSSAMEVFSSMPEKDTAVYNALMDGFVKTGDVQSARRVFDSMLERNVVSWTCLIHGYSISGKMEAARELFDAMPQRNLYSWNVMISGYCQNQEHGKALSLFRELQSQSCPFEPNEVTVVNVIPAITATGAVDLGWWAHEFVRRKGFGWRANVTTSLIDMHAKCGNLEEARRLFNQSNQKDVTLWNAMINGLALNGHSREALLLFEKMRRNGISPSSVTMIGVLSACSHGGLVKEGRWWFCEMEALGISKKVEHYGCMVDLLGRCGHLDEALELMDKMPSGPNGIILSSLLFACASRGDVDLAERVMKRAVEVEPWNIGNYIIMRNLYAAEKMWREALAMKGEINKLGGKNEAGCSLVEVGSHVWEFVSGDKAHPKCEVINYIVGCLQLHMQIPVEKEFDFTGIIV